MPNQSDNRVASRMEAQLRIACFLQGRELPSSRFRILQFQEELQSRGIYLDAIYPLISKEGWTPRGARGPVRALTKFITRLLLYVPTRVLQICLARLKRYDVVVIQKSMGGFRKRAMLEFLVHQFNPRIVLDIDDAEYTGPTGQPVVARSALFEIAAMAKVIVVGNRYLAKQLDPCRSKAIVLPTTVNGNRFCRLTHGFTEPVSVGWTGTASNYCYLIQLANVFWQLADRFSVRFKIIGNGGLPMEFTQIPHLTYSEWREASEIEDLQEIDIGIMPLADSEWTKGKCAFKLIQYMSMGIPAVASPVGANVDVLKHGVTGFFATTEQEWITCLQMLITDRELRLRMGRAARERYESKFSYSRNVDKLEYIFKCVARDEFPSQNHIGR